MSAVDPWHSSGRRGADQYGRVYVSSAARDLKKARERVIKTVRGDGFEPVAMESYPADTRPPLEKCLQDVRSCDVYVGIVAWRYGSCPPGERKSFTHLEYEEAVRHRKEILLFHHDENAPWPPAQVDGTQQDVQQLRDLQAKAHGVANFATIDELAGRVRKALHEVYGSVGAPVPELLPYTVDRDAQKESLAAAVERGDLERSPSALVVHGAVRQAHRKFVDYMTEHLLKQYLGVKALDKVPIALRAPEFEPDVITGRIARRCHLAPTADIDVLSRRLHDSEVVTVLWFPVEVDVQYGRPDAWQIAQLLEYFARWPQEKPLRVLPIISAQYRQTKDWRRFLRPGVAASDNRFGRAIEQAVTDAVANCGAVVLPELTNVEEMEVVVWTDQAEVRRRLRGRDPGPEIRRMFRKTERSSKQRGIPMETLATELTGLLKGTV